MYCCWYAEDAGMIASMKAFPGFGGYRGHSRRLAAPRWRGSCNHIASKLESPDGSQESPLVSDVYVCFVFWLFRPHHETPTQFVVVIFSFSFLLCVFALPHCQLNVVCRRIPSGTVALAWRSRLRRLQRLMSLFLRRRRSILLSR